MPENDKRGFFLADQLKRDTIHVCELGLSSLLLMNDKRYPWLILVPRVAKAEELFDLNRVEQNFLMEEISVTSKALSLVSQPDKINVAAIGNMVRQLHVHVVARYTTDMAWPAPIWGKGEAEPYRDQAKAYLSLLHPQIKHLMVEE